VLPTLILLDHIKRFNSKAMVSLAKSIKFSAALYQRVLQLGGVLIPSSYAEWLRAVVVLALKARVN
jgi:hypothetical protein